MTKRFTLETQENQELLKRAIRDLEIDTPIWTVAMGDDGQLVILCTNGREYEFSPSAEGRADEEHPAAPVDKEHPNEAPRKRPRRTARTQAGGPKASDTKKNNVDD